MEKKFFEAFEVEKEHKCGDKKHCRSGEYKGVICNGTCEECEIGVLVYPSITPEIVLKLINIILKARGEFRLIGSFSSIEVIKDKVCQACIQLQPEIQTQVQELFNQAKEGE